MGYRLLSAGQLGYHEVRLALDSFSQGRENEPDKKIDKVVQDDPVVVSRSTESMQDKLFSFCSQRSDHTLPPVHKKYARAARRLATLVLRSALVLVR